MTNAEPSTFQAQLLCPAQPGEDEAWAFLLLPKAVSDTLPRRGRTSVEVGIKGYRFQATLEPDGQLSHWLKLSQERLEAAGLSVGEMLTVQIAALAREPEPQLPEDLRQALAASPAATAVWQATTTLARLDWIHWIESAKQAKTRRDRVIAACDMLSAGKKRVCCFDPSGFYSKSLSAPRAVGE